MSAGGPVGGSYKQSHGWQKLGDVAEALFEKALANRSTSEIVNADKPKRKRSPPRRKSRRSSAA